MRILNWNIHGASGIRPAKQAEIIAAILHVSPDVVLLQEVPLGAGFLERLTAHGYATTEPAKHPMGLWENKRKSAAAIASRLPAIIEWSELGIMVGSGYGPKRATGALKAPALVAESEGFEPSVTRRPQRLSRPPHSSALATFRLRH